MNRSSLASSCTLYAVVALLATLLRTAYLLIAQQQDLFAGLFLDSEHYAAIARNIVLGRGAAEGAYVMSPLYPYFLSLFANASGELAVWWVRSIQAGAGVVSCVLVASLALHMARPLGMGPFAGWLAGLTCAVYGPLIHQESSVLVESLQGFILILALWLLIVGKEICRKPLARNVLWWSAGILMGLAAGLRPVALLLLAVSIAAVLLLAWINEKSFRKALLPCLLLMAGSSMAIAPFTLRNYAVTKEFVLLSAYGGMNFWIGNHKHANGLFNTPPDYGFALDPIGVEVARKNTGLALSQKQASDWWTNRAMSDIREDPLRWSALYARKLLLFMHPREIPQLGNDFHWFAKRAWPLQFPLNALPLLLLSLTLPLTLLWTQRSHTFPVLLSWSWLPIYMAGIALFFITGRYRIPVMPLVISLAAVHVAMLGKLLFDTRRYLASLITIIALIFAVYVLTRTLNSPRWLPESNLVTGLVERQRGMALYQQKKFAEAEQWYRRSLAIKDNPITRGNLANALKAQGRIDEAEQEYRDALQAAPKDHVAWYNLGNLYRDHRRDPVRAAEYYEKSIALNRKFAEAYLNLALVYWRSQQPEQALRIIDGGLTHIDTSRQEIREQLLRLKIEISLRKS